jgi:hypothetical protein
VAEVDWLWIVVAERCRDADRKCERTEGREGEPCSPWCGVVVRTSRRSKLDASKSDESTRCPLGRGIGNQFGSGRVV